MKRGWKLQLKTIAAVDSVLTGRMVREERERRNLTQSTLAARMGVPESFLSRLENGRYDWNEDLFQRATKGMEL